MHEVGLCWNMKEFKYCSMVIMLFPIFAGFDAENHNFLAHIKPVFRIQSRKIAE